MRTRRHWRPKKLFWTVRQSKRNFLDVAVSKYIFSSQKPGDWEGQIRKRVLGVKKSRRTAHHTIGFTFLTGVIFSSVKKPYEALRKFKRIKSNVYMAHTIFVEGREKVTQALNGSSLEHTRKWVVRLCANTRKMRGKRNQMIDTPNITIWKL